MQNAVVLGGDQDIRENIDGEIALVNQMDGDADLNVPAGGDAEFIIQAGADCNITKRLDGECGIITRVNEGAYPEYTGQTVVTPTQEMQVLETANRSLLSNIIINPIPENYGLITWNGSTLTVS